MTKLHIALQDGFAGDTVAIRLNGQEVYRKDGVRTDLRISRADSFDVEAPDGLAKVEVDARHSSASAQIDPERTPNVAVDLDGDGRPPLNVSSGPFAHL